MDSFFISQFLLVKADPMTVVLYDITKILVATFQAFL